MPHTQKKLCLPLTLDVKPGVMACDKFNPNIVASTHGGLPCNLRNGLLDVWINVTCRVKSPSGDEQTIWSGNQPGGDATPVLLEAPARQLIAYVEQSLICE